MLGNRSHSLPVSSCCQAPSANAVTLIALSLQQPLPKLISFFSWTLSLLFQKSYPSFFRYFSFAFLLFGNQSTVAATGILIASRILILFSLISCLTLISNESLYLIKAPSNLLTVIQHISKKQLLIIIKSEDWEHYNPLWYCSISHFLTIGS